MDNKKLSWEKILKNELDLGSRKFIILGGDTKGEAIKQLLEQEKKDIVYIVIDEVSKLNILKQDEYSDYVILFCSNGPESYTAMYKQMVKYASKNRIINMEPDDFLFSKLQYAEPRVSALECAAREIQYKEIAGNVAEAGVWRGDFAKYINRFFPSKKLYLIDTFEGFDRRDIIIDKDNSFSDGAQDWSNTSVELVLSKMQYRENCIIRKGYFPETMNGIKDEFCFVSLDMDLYQPIYEGLHYFYPQLSHGGYIFIHDCRNPGYQGARKALINFCNEMNIGYVLLQDEWGTAVVTK